MVLVSNPSPFPFSQAQVNVVGEVPFCKAQVRVRAPTNRSLLAFSVKVINHCHQNQTPL